jgi:hypothetical protein
MLFSLPGLRRVQMRPLAADAVCPPVCLPCLNAVAAALLPRRLYSPHVSFSQGVFNKTGDPANIGYATGAHS